MVNDPTHRFVKEKKTPVIESAAPKTEEELKEELMKTEAQSQKEQPAGTDPFSPQKEEVELITDLDLEQFYLTGELEYEFKIADKVPVVIRIMDGEEQFDTNDKLFGLLSSETTSYANAMLRHSQNVVGYALVKYGGTNVQKMSPEDRMKFVMKLKAPIIGVIGKKYASLERTLTEALNDSEKIKN